MHNELRLALRDLFREVKPKPDDFVISTERSKRASPQVIVNLFARWYEILGFNGSHSGRRTFITNAARKISTVRSTRARDSVDKAHTPSASRARYRLLRGARSAGNAAPVMNLPQKIFDLTSSGIGFLPVAVTAAHARGAAAALLKTPRTARYVKESWIRERE
jgi:hypothetical protein